MGDFKKIYLDAVAAVFPEFATVELADAFEVMAAHLSDVGKKMNLTSITDDGAVLWLHIIDSLYAAKEIQKCGATLVADVGSGGGFPALPIAAALPGVKVTAIDSTAKKCAYIAECAEMMGLSNVNSLSVRAEEWGMSDGRGAYDAVCARAVASLPILAELCAPLVRTGGHFIPMKGASALAEEADARHAAKVLGITLEGKTEYSLPPYADGRVIFVYRKSNETPPAYPRKYAKITKNPL